MEWIYRPTQIYCLYVFSHSFTMQNIWYYIYPDKGLYIVYIVLYTQILDSSWT